MRKKSFYLLILLICLVSSPAQALGTKQELVQIKSAKRSVTYVYFHPSEPIEFKPVVALGKVGMTENLASMAKRNQAVAAINGTFFNAYDPKDLQPQGAILNNQQLLHFRGGPTLMGIQADNKLVFGITREMRIIGSRNGSWEWPNSWHAWFVNHLPTTQQEIVIFTHQFRTNQLVIPGYTFVVVDQGKIVSIVKDKTSIPSNGFVIAYGNVHSNKAEEFHVGDTMEYKVEYPAQMRNIKHVISVGPKLVTGGKYDVNFERDGIRDPKLHTQVGQRSFIGIKKDQTIVMGTVPSVTIPQLAEITLKLGLTEAMNLDGGASSGLYYGGKLLTAPGRNLSNCLIIVPKQKQ